MRRATSAASEARADGVKNRFPLHFMAKAEWNGRTDGGLRAVRVAADGSSMRWARAGRQTGGQGAEEEEGKNVLSVFNK